MSMSAYRIGKKVWLVHTEQAAHAELPQNLPIGSVVLTTDEAASLAYQILAAASKSINDKEPVS